MAQNNIVVMGKKGDQVNGQRFLLMIRNLFKIKFCWDCYSVSVKKIGCCYIGCYGDLSRTAAHIFKAKVEVMLS